MIHARAAAAATAALCLGAAAAAAGPYSAALDDAFNPYDAPVPGFVGPHGDGKARVLESEGVNAHPNNFVNPLFAGWASGVADYSPTPGVAGAWADPANALGPVTGDNFHIVSLGDLSSSQIATNAPPGSITLTFARQIRNLSGADFVCFENGLISAGGAGMNGQILAELAFVEVSSDGHNFARLASRSLTPSAVGSFGTIDASNVFGLAGKHVNAYGESWGTPFDLGSLAADPLVAAGVVDLDAITHVRLVDLPGNGAFTDSTGAPVYDAWRTMGSGGHDLEAVGVISHNLDFTSWRHNRGVDSQDWQRDSDGDGLPDILEYATGLNPTVPDAESKWQSVSVFKGQLSLHCRRDERVTDIILEVEGSPDLRSWKVIARSTAGASFVPVAPHTPTISEASASEIRSVGVFRAATITDPSATMRFMRLRAHIIP